MSRQVAVVTGAARGIGLEIARKLGERGYAVLLTDLESAAGRAAAAQAGPEAWFTALDVRDPDAHRAVAAQATERGRLAVWVNNAGVLTTKPAWDHDSDEIRLLVETNLLGAMSGCIAAIEAMDATAGGDIINIASISGLGPVPGLSVYSATKHAVVGFTASLQGDLDRAGRPIRVHALCPDAVATDMTSHRADDPSAAILFSGAHLSPADVADRAVALIGTHTIVRTMPPWRAPVVHFARLAPRPGLRAMALFRRLGERRLARATSRAGRPPRRRVRSRAEDTPGSRAAGADRPLLPGPLNLHRAGSGPPLVLLHGVGHHWQAWQPVIDILASRFEILAVDLPGFGRSPALAPGVTPTIPALAAVLHDELQRLDIRRPHIAGNSMGGAIALELALAGHAASATAFSPAGFWTDPERRYCQISLGLLANLPRPTRPAVKRLARTRPGRAVLFAQLVARPSRLPTDEAVAALNDAWAAPGFATTLAAFNGYEVAGRATPDHVAVTVAWGAYDWLLPARLQAPRARLRLSDAHHVTLRTGHLPYFDDPRAVAQTIETTVARAGAPAEANASEPDTT